MSFLCSSLLSTCQRDESLYRNVTSLLSFLFFSVWSEKGVMQNDANRDDCRKANKHRCMTSNEHFDRLDWKQDIKYSLALTEITAACSATISNREMAALGQTGGPCSIVFPHLVWQLGNKTCLKQKLRLGQMRISPYPAPFSLLLYDCDFSEVPGVTSAWCGRGEMAEGVVVMGFTPTSAAVLSHDLGLVDPSPCAGFPSCEKMRAE